MFHGERACAKTVSLLAGVVLVVIRGKHDFTFFAGDVVVEIMIALSLATTYVCRPSV